MSKAAQLHVQLEAGGPDEAFSIVGSAKGLGAWNPADAAGLVWRNEAWVTEQPVYLEPGSHVELKFVRQFPDGAVTWEDKVPNRAIDVPPVENMSVCLNCRFNGDASVNLEPDSLGQAGFSGDSDNMDNDDVCWRIRQEEAAADLANRQRDFEMISEQHRCAKNRLSQEAQELRAELAEVRQQLQRHRQLLEVPDI